MVLRALSEAPFEPLHKASLYCVAFKSAFLVAIASGHRISTLHTLSFEPGHIRWEPAGVCLIPRPDFITKNQSLISQSVEIFLPSTSFFVSSIEPFKAISKASISRWLVECISMAGPEALVSGKF